MLRQSKIHRNLGLWAVVLSTASASAAQADRRAVEFFENKVRPVLVQHCLQCHSAAGKQTKGGLALDTSQRLLKGGNSGPALVPGDPEASLIVRVVRGLEKDLRMPPGKVEGLSPAQIDDLAAWIKMGAALPGLDKPATTEPAAGNLDEARKFWSFQPVRSPVEPKVKRTDWPADPIDRFVLAKLEEKGLSPSPAADARTLIRRISYDLTGLPPTADEVEAFAAAHAKDPRIALEALVDRLSASPRYGEHWGRHWLDVARYGDTRWVGAGEDRRLPFAYTYRDWVIDALNRDVPYDRFVSLQLAADQMPDAKPADLAALGFLTGGKWFTGNLHEVIDDQIDVVTRGLLGLTAQCARCHNHKFDPVSAKDYYSLYGLFASSRMPVDGTGMLGRLPELRRPPVEAAREKELDADRDALDKFLKDRQVAVRDRFRPIETMADYLLAATPVFAKTDKEIRESAKARNLDENVLLRWSRLLKRTAKEPQPVFGPWHAFAAIPEAEFAAKAAEVAAGERAKKLNKHVAPLVARPPASLRELALAYAKLFAEFDKPENSRDNETETLRQVLRGNDSPVQPPLNELGPYLTKDEKDRIPEMRRTLLRKLGSLSDEADRYVVFRREAGPVFEDWRTFLERRRDELQTEFRTPAKAIEYVAAAREAIAQPARTLKSIADAKKLNEAMLLRFTAFVRADPKATDEALAQRASTGRSAPTEIALDDLYEFLSKKDRDELKGKESKLLRLFNDHAGAPARAMVFPEGGRPYAQKVFVRGNPSLPGEDASGRFLEVLSTSDRPAFREGSGRRQLAEAIVEPANPLTARVIVNRVWMHHFGAGLVDTPSDFGTRGDRPSHPELLDALASWFVADGWSLKRLHKRILLSTTYRQSSADNPAARAVDPGNRLLWRASRRRLEFEEIRDTLLTVAGSLDESAGGRADDLVKPSSRRRTVYGFLDRLNLPGFLRSFDFPSPDVHVAGRLETTVPQQALFLMNGPFVMDQAARLAERTASASTPADRVAALHRFVFARPPSKDELELGLAFVAAEPTAPASSDPWRYGCGRYSASTDRVVGFEPFEHFVNNSWKGAALENDPVFGRIALNSRGGHAGADRRQTVIRRWIAPRDAVVNVTGVLSVQPGSLQPSGEGVRGRIVSSRHGQLGSWVVHGTEEPTDLAALKVERGDTLDFVVEARGNDPFGSFAWAPTVSVPGVDLKALAKLPPKAKTPDGVWDATRDFAGSDANRRTYGAWERYAQVLLQTNEFLFLD